MKILRFPDRFNPCKAWLVKRYKSGNYYLNQEICGQTFYDGFVRVTAKFLADLLDRKEMSLCFAEGSDISAKKES
ncbi:MAG: hypothetical protein NC084_09775 [Bacteroides sp.]|nr:hypothetical protein [Eubacterium sp.]MCM1419427.1 hypothetical protein [Roseburia sp.]MCM1462986.1 hypothetical protein [Bacteroides sp.]